MKCRQLEFVLFCVQKMWQDPLAQPRDFPFFPGGLVCRRAGSR